MPEEKQLHPDVARIYDIFGLHHSHPISVLEVNVRNTSASPTFFRQWRVNS